MPSTVRVPWLQLFKISSTGAIVTKIAANNTATSTIGPNVNALRSRCSLGAAAYALSARTALIASGWPTADGLSADAARPAARLVDHPAPGARTDAAPCPPGGSPHIP